MAKQTILVVDDDENIVRSLKDNIAEISDNYIVKTSDDGRKALELLEKEKMDLVILDIHIPGTNGLQILTELYNKGKWLPIIITTDSYLDEGESKLGEFGIVDLIKKPFLPEEVVIRIDEMMKNREKKDLIKNLGLPSILQLIEMDKRTGILTLKIGNENGMVFFKDGKVMDIEVKGLSRDEALIAFINSLYEDREVSIEYINHRKEKKIKMTLMQIVMEASRLKDERKNTRDNAEPGSKNREIPKSEDLEIITSLLNSLKEVEGFVIADEQGDALAASPKDYREEILNLGLYLWVIGHKTGKDLHLGEARSLVCSCKGKKRLIRAYRNLIIILQLKEMTKFSTFKEKLNTLLTQVSLEIRNRE
jgi:DNA-binding response OmpR family regulator